MSEGRQVPDLAAWGCLGAGMILLGAFCLYVFEIAAGTDYEMEYMAAASVAGGAAILVMLALHSHTDRKRFRLPRLSPLVTLAALAILFVLLLF